MNNYTYSGFTFNEPTPMEKIIVEDTLFNRLVITVSTKLCRQWLFRVAPNFGEFDCYDNSNWKFYLTVNKTYSVKTVKEFLESYVEL